MLELELKQFLARGFLFADLSAEPGLPPEICPACAAEGVVHQSGLMAAWCDCRNVGAVRIPSTPWRLVYAPDQKTFFAGVFHTPTLAAEKIVNGATIQ